jgi:hypothetical protein
MAKFTKKPPIVEAVQFHKGEQPAELAPFVGHRIIFSADMATLTVKTPGQPLVVTDGGWIVIHPHGHLEVMTPEQFEAEYEAAPGGKADQFEPKAQGGPPAPPPPPPSPAPVALAPKPKFDPPKAPPPPPAHAGEPKPGFDPKEPEKPAHGMLPAQEPDPEFISD